MEGVVLAESMTRGITTMKVGARGTEVLVLATGENIAAGSRSPGRRRNHTPVREGSEERRAKIEQWNREREQPRREENVLMDVCGMEISSMTPSNSHLRSMEDIITDLNGVSGSSPLLFVLLIYTSLH
ncbi:Splicing factor U2af small subunit B [Morella rubra]|uniref:Splicing factor U2af small subunit B n=1 Tax=Morella rubra TaxID=262757 RepID=A0A6A1WUA5_9ROSI|nr:Splicing factor U2af small subunit B [Morella rubra]